MTPNQKLNVQFPMVKTMKTLCSFHWDHFQSKWMSTIYWISIQVKLVSFVQSQEIK